MKPGDIVRIHTQPSNQATGLLGRVGYIEEITDRYAQIETFTSDGRFSGCGTVPLSCLSLEPGQVWRIAKEKLDDERKRFAAEAEAYNKAREERLRALAKKHGMSVRKLKVIQADLGRMDP